MYIFQSHLFEKQVIDPWKVFAYFFGGLKKNPPIFCCLFYGKKKTLQEHRKLATIFSNVPLNENWQKITFLCICRCRYINPFCKNLMRNLMTNHFNTSSLKLFMSSLTILFLVPVQYIASYYRQLSSDIEMKNYKI